MINKSAMIEIFKTNVQKVSQAKRLVMLLLQNFPAHKINFDMHDCDKILRVEGENFMPAQVTIIVNEDGFTCTVLEN